MAQLTHPILGTIDLSKSGFWEAEVTVRERVVTVDLTVEEAPVAASVIEGLPQSAADLEKLERAGRAAMVADARSGDDDAAAVLYLTHHHQELPPPEYLRLFGAAAPDLTNPDLALSRLALVRVGLYPDQEERKIVLDYSIDTEATNYLLCVVFDAEGEIVAVDMES